MTSWDDHCLEAEKPTYCCFQHSLDPLDVSGLKQRRVIIDGANLLYLTKNALPGASMPNAKYDSLVLLQLAYYLDFYGFRVKIMLRSDFLKTTSNPDVLHELIDLGYAFVSSKNDKEDDDRAALEAAYRVGAVIITNDKFRNHHGYGFSVKGNLCTVKVDNPVRKRGEWPHYSFQKPLEHFYFINPGMDLQYRRAMEEDAHSPHDPVRSCKLANLFKFVCAVGWFQLHGEWSTEFPKAAYQIPIDCRYLTTKEWYSDRNIFYPPNMIDKSIADGPNSQLQ
uniref:RNase NYN domain-containing protein n=1 Tax=Panagrellus redivivus TaxID=6233 RepID=A0A7E4ZSF6_PANRE